MARLIAPLQNLTRQIKDIHAETNQMGHVTVSTGDEVEELANSFNLLFEKLVRREGELEQHVKSRTVQLEATNRELDSFSYSVSHDLRGPIRHIEGYSRMLVEDHSATLDENANELLQRILRSCQKMNELINALLALSRLNQSEINLVAVNLSLIAEDVVSTLRQTEPDRQVEIRIAENINAIADPSLIRVALQNLLDNAWKYTRNLQHSIITFDSMEQNGHTVFFIRDNGAGFDMKYVKDLFAPFRRLHRDNEFEGIGIGLATVQRIIHRHEGNIWAEGSIDGGSTFFFTLNPERSR
jgi:light-regulated signal transduction histidine kinase (bacteriophytochrome)